MLYVQEKISGEHLLFSPIYNNFKSLSTCDKKRLKKLIFGLLFNNLQIILNKLGKNVNKFQFCGKLGTKKSISFGIIIAGARPQN